MKKGGSVALLVALAVALLFIFSASSVAAAMASGGSPVPVQWGKLLDTYLDYQSSCPEAGQHIVASILGKAHYQDPRILLRFHLYCFAKAGCDASLLLDSRSGSSIVNEDSVARGFEIAIDGIKAACCPGTAISCADILALAAARDREAAAAAPAGAAPPDDAPPALQAPARRLLIKGTTTTLRIIGTADSTGAAPSAQPPTRQPQRGHATKFPRWLISLVSVLSAILGVAGGIIGLHCCYNNRIEVYVIRHGQEDDEAHQHVSAGDLEMSEIKN